MATGVSAIRGSSLQIVIVVDVASGASNVGVAVDEQKACGAVIKGRSSPTDGVVAIRAIGCGERSASGLVRRIVSGLPGAEVAARIAAIGRSRL